MILFQKATLITLRNFLVMKGSSRLISWRMESLKQWVAEYEATNGAVLLR